MTFMEVFFGKRAPALERLEGQAKEMDILHKTLAEVSTEISMVRRTLVEKSGGIESCNVCEHFTPPFICSEAPAPVTSAGWCPSFKRKLS